MIETCNTQQHMQPLTCNASSEVILRSSTKSYDLHACSVALCAHHAIFDPGIAYPTGNDNVENHLCQGVTELHRKLGGAGNVLLSKNCCSAKVSLARFMSVSIVLIVLAAHECTCVLCIEPPANCCTSVFGVGDAVRQTRQSLQVCRVYCGGINCYEHADLS